MYLLDGVGMMGWGCWRVLLGGNEVDGYMAAQLDMMVGADGGENGAGQGAVLLDRKKGRRKVSTGLQVEGNA